MWLRRKNEPTVGLGWNCISFPSVPSMSNPMVKSALENFPKAKIQEIYTQTSEVEKSEDEAYLTSYEEEWDPFEDND